MVAQPEFFRAEQKSVDVPIWRELFMGVDWWTLRWSPVYFGCGVPRGDGSGVILVPGFLADDSYLWELNLWLARIGYRPYMSQIGRNADCFDIQVDKLQKTVEKAYLETGRKVHIIGHSLGGMLARSAAELSAAQVASVITMGSPFRGLSSHPVVLRASKIVQQRIKDRDTRPGRHYCFTQNCDCAGILGLLQSLQASKIKQTAIYSKTDGIVDWHNCINNDPSLNFEVSSTHGGMAFNPKVYRLLALRLAEANTARLERPASQTG